MTIHFRVKNILTDEEVGFYAHKDVTVKTVIEMACAYWKMDSKGCEMLIKGDECVWNGRTLKDIALKEDALFILVDEQHVPGYVDFDEGPYTPTTKENGGIHPRSRKNITTNRKTTPPARKGPIRKSRIKAD